MNVPKNKLISFFYKAFWGNYINNEKGFVLVLTLMMISLMSVLAITSFELVTSTTKITSNHKLYLQALYVADAGVEDALRVLSDSSVSWASLDFATPDTLSTLNLDTSFGWETFDSVNDKWTVTNSDLGDSYTITLTMDAGDLGSSDDDRIKVESTATVSGFTKTIEAMITNSPDVIITRWMEND